MENGWVWVQNEMLRLVKEQADATTSGIVTKKIIVLMVHRPDVPSIDLVDLPGLTTMPVDKAREVQAVLKRQLEEDERSGAHGMYLVVVPGSGDVRPCTNMAMRFVEDNNLREKTFGVFSKCDQAADSDALQALMTGKQTSDGYSPEDLGAVGLSKGWVATMLKPLSDPMFDVHNFERIHIQQMEEADFFKKDPILQSLSADELTGIGALVSRLEREYSDYLNTTWKKGAMKKIFQKLVDKEFELCVLGVVTEPCQKDMLAKKEVERRLGPDSPVHELLGRFLKDVLRDSLCRQIRFRLAYLLDATWDVYDLLAKLEEITKIIDDVTEPVLAEVAPFFIQPLQNILTAESMVESDGPISSLNIVTTMSRARVSLFRERQPKRAALKKIKESPFIQLSQYRSFTDAIVLKCKLIFEDAVLQLRGDIEMLSQRIVDVDSPWLQIKSPFIETTADPESSVNATLTVKPCLDVDAFLNALVTVFLRRIPALKELQRVHVGITVGIEEEVAATKHKQLTEEINLIKAARDGICRALDIGDEALAELQKELDAEANF
mmetsp:Transcript_21785/g.48153  ORF Transcript_21785/g.48153 Transcript_21785/m.48153 type:complete len:551 (-) Transcript_21785:284-1936(-)